MSNPQKNKDAEPPSTELTTPAKGIVAKNPVGWTMSQAEHENVVRARVPDELQEAVIWLGMFLTSRCQNSKARLRHIAKDAGFSQSLDYFTQVLDGRYFIYNPNLGAKGRANIAAMVEALQEWDRRKQNTALVNFAATSLYEGIINYITAKRVLDTVCKWGAIIGHNGLGKSTALQKFKDDNNHKQTVYIEAPTARTLTDLQFKLCECYNIVNRRITRKEMERELRDNISESKTIIIDNAQRLWNRANQQDQMCLNWLQEIQDDTKCTIILSWTPVSDMHKAMSDENVLHLRQFVGRIGGLEEFHILPEKIPAEDVKLIARESFLLHPALWTEHKEALLKLARGPYNLRPFCLALQKARRRATAAESKYIEAEHLVLPATA